MVINGSIAQIPNAHCIESCTSWSGKAPRRPSQIRDNCQAVCGTSDSANGKTSHAAEVKCGSVQFRLLKTFELIFAPPGKGNQELLVVAMMNACARRPI